MNKKDSIKDYLLAGNTETPPVKLSRLAHNRYARIRSRVAENPSTSVALLLALSGDSEVDVRIAVSNNPNIPPSLLAYLAGDECPDVRYALAENYQLAFSLLNRLAQDANPYVADRAQRSLNARACFRLISASNGGQKLISLKVSQLHAQAFAHAQALANVQAHKKSSRVYRAQFAEIAMGGI